MTAAGFRKMPSTVGEARGLPHVHPHVLRYSCGFYTADRHEDMRVMQDWLGHGMCRTPFATPRWRQAGLTRPKRRAEG
jgi:site-specific recombinase XerC